MTWKERLRSNLLFRNLLTDVIGIPASTRRKTFTSYFQYKIGVYQPDYFLYFTEQPNLVRYTNDIFNKLFEYEGYELVQFLEFNYSVFASEQNFLRFVSYETNQD